MRRDRGPGPGARGGGARSRRPGAEGVEIDPEELAAFAAERIARFKLPRTFEIRAELPKTPTGKISKGPLREELSR